MKQGVPQASLRAQWNDHAELRGAGDRNTPRRKIPFSRAKIASLQFPRPEIRRILAETGGGARRPPPVAEAGRSKPNKQGRVASEPVSAAARPLRIVDVAVAGGAHEARALWDGASPRAVRETGRSRRSPEGVEGRGHAQRASAAPEYRASEAQAGTKTPMRAKETAQPVGRTKAARSARNRP